MRYIGGKKRQSKIIANYIMEHKGNRNVYVEPFCGMCSVASRLTNEFDTIILADNNKHIVNLLKSLVDDTFVPYQWVSQEQTEKEHKKFKAMKDKGIEHPMMAFWGHGMSFAAKWFGTLARSKDASGVKSSKSHVRNSNRGLLELQEKLKQIKNLTIVHSSYDELNIPNNSVVYCDPPYKGRNNMYGNVKQFDHNDYWDWVRQLSTDDRLVIATEYTIPDDFEIIHNWGDTAILRKNNKFNTNEVLCKLKRESV